MLRSEHRQECLCYYQRWQRCSARCSFKRAMAMATRSASCRSSEGESLRSLMRFRIRSEEHTSELQSRLHLVCRLLLEKKKKETLQRCWDADRNPVERG